MPTPSRIQIREGRVAGHLAPSLTHAFSHPNTRGRVAGHLTQLAHAHALSHTNARGLVIFFFFSLCFTSDIYGISTACHPPRASPSTSPTHPRLLAHLRPVTGPCYWPPMSACTLAHARPRPLVPNARGPCKCPPPRCPRTITPRPLAHKCERAVMYLYF
jgi:hypothetical protein